MRRKSRAIPGISAPAQTDLPVLYPLRVASPGGATDLLFSRWLAVHAPHFAVILLVAIALWPLSAYAQSQYTIAEAFGALWHWLPLLVFDGFLLNVLISFLTMAIGTALGVVLGLGQISPNGLIQFLARWTTQLFRNSPWLVLLFIVMLAFPFEINLGFATIPVPDWIKAVLGLALPIMANISEIVRGAVQSVPTGQWEAAESLAYSRRQTLWRIILPQCFKRMIPPWMNWYAILTMATPLVSLLGVEEIVTLARQGMEAEDNHPELLLPFYGFCLVIFFAYCYPIARWTIALEKRFALKL